MEDYPIKPLTNDLINDYFHLCLPPPKQLTMRGVFPIGKHLKFLAIVGARNHTLYGNIVCEQLISGLTGYPIVIVSGLAHGIDAIVHTIALAHGLTCVAFPGSGLHESVLYPRKNYHLAKQILDSGGCLISEYDPLQSTAPWIFPMRNRLIAGCAHATLIIESIRQSGSRITARLAIDYNRDVLAVPGPITSELSVGPNELIKQGAIPITTSQDILFALGITPKSENALDNNTNTKSNRTHRFATTPSQSYSTAPSLFELIPITKEHEHILRVLTHPTHKNNLLIHCPNLTAATLDARLSELELMNKIKSVLGVIYKQ